MKKLILVFSGSCSTVAMITFHFIVFTVTNLWGQSTAKISNVDFSLSHDSLFITYDLLEAGKKEKFEISLIISTVSGKTTYPQAIVGDVGENNTGGMGKKIIWDINKDSVFINEGISVEITAELMPPEIRFVHRGTAALLSAVVPGLGITKLNNGGPYWIMAIAFYGCAAGSYLYYQSAESDYDKYKSSMTESERNDLYSQVENKDRISDVLMYTAGAVWVGNMIWTLVQPNKTKPNDKGISFSGTYDPIARAPLFSVKYRF